MNLSPKLKEVRWRLLIALHVLLFLCDIAWAHAPVSTTSPEALAASHTGAGAREAVAGGGAYAINHSPAIEALQCTLPGASIATPLTLTCTRQLITLSGSATEPSVTYLWAGPSGYTSALQNPQVSLPGTYTLTVTNNVGGCTSTASVEVIQNVALPGATAAVSHAIDCANATVNLQATTGISNATFLWLGNNFASAQQNPAITAPGGYTLNVTNPVNGCTSTATVNVTQSITKPGVTPFVSGPITCTTTEVQLDASSPTAEAVFSWTGPGNYSNNTQSPFVSLEGVYTARATNPLNSCFSTATITVQKNVTAPGATITPSGQVTCVNTSITLNGGATASDVNYSWTGPSPFVPTSVQNPTASAAGTYVLTVTKASNGCTTQTNYTLVPNTTRPGATASVSAQLNCTNSSVQLIGNSSTTDVSYRWIGPAGSGFPSTLKEPFTSTKGGYTVIVTNNANGCTSNAGVNVIQSIVAPQNVAIAAPEVLTCTRQSVTLAGSSTTSNVTYLWTGPGQITGGNTNSASVGQPGDYTLRVTNPANQCFVERTVTVLQNITNPGVSIPTPAKFTCIVSAIHLQAISGAGMQYAWTGPGNFTSTVFNPEVTVSGTYNVIVTNPVNGCTSQTSVTTQEDKAEPGADASVVGNLPLTCSLGTVFLQGNSNSGTHYSWSGPDNYTSSEQGPSTTISGLYTLIVTNQANGCTSQDVVFVNQDITKPTGVLASSSGDITCDQPTISLFGDPSSADLSYAWTGPEGFTSADQNLSGIDTPGIYRLTVTKNSNGCNAQSEVTVIRNNTAPEGVAANVSSALTCAIESVTLTGASTTPGVTYSWSGPGIITVLTPTTASVSTAGTYQLTVNNAANGCSATAFVTVQQNITQPGVVASVVNNQKLTCTVLNVTLHAASVPDATFTWSGPDGYANNQQSPTANKAGVYTVVATDPDNGCTSTHSVTVEEDIEDPQGVTASFTGTGIITCDQPNVAITGASSTPNVNYSWSGTGTVTNPLQASASVATPGLYTVTVTNPANGCDATASVTVTRNIEAPQNVAIGKPDGTLLTCVKTMVPLNATTSTSNVTYTWTAVTGGAFTIPTPATAAVTGPGTYNLVVKNNANGCVTSPANVVVTQNITTTNGNISTPNGTALTCATGSLPLNGSGSPAGAVSFRWEGPSGFTAATQNTSATAPGEYALIITHNISGCFRRVTTPITQSLTTITATANANSALNCVNSLVTLTGAAQGANQFTWTGPGIVGSANTAQTTVNAGGTYTLNVRTPGNCTATATVFVPSNFSVPENVAITSEGTLSECSDGVTLTGNSSTVGASYLWIFPDGTEINDQETLAMNPGVYTLIVKHPDSECTDTRTIELTEEPCIGNTAFNSTAQLINIENAFIAGVYPNPAKDKASIEFTPDGNYHATVEVYTLLNVKVATPYMGEVSAGKTYTAEFDSGNHLNGVYIYRIVYGSGKTKEGRFIVMH